MQLNDFYMVHKETMMNDQEEETCISDQQNENNSYPYY